MRSRYILSTLYMAVLLMFCDSVIAGGLELYESAGEKMPKFMYFTLDGKKFTNKDLDKEKRYLFVYFNPHCEVCIEETEDLLTNIKYFKDIQIIMVSPNRKADIEQFVAYFNLKEYDQITVLQDTEDTFYKEFGAIGYPNMYAYDSNHDLLEYFDSKVEFRKIKAAFDPALSRENY